MAGVLLQIWLKLTYCKRISRYRGKYIFEYYYYRQPLSRPQAEDIVVGDLVRQHAAGQRAAALDLALGTLTRVYLV